MTPTARILLIETATSRALVALAAASGEVIAADGWHSGHRHGEELLPRLDRLLSASATSRGDLAGVAVGVGPGSFTGLRIGMATAKTICHSLRLPITGLPTMEMLAHAASGEPDGGPADGTIAVVLPAGVGDRYVARYAVSGSELTELLPPTLTPAADVAELAQAGDTLIAVDVAEPEASAQAVARGERAQSGLAGVMAAAAAPRLARGESADLAALVPHYVALPRGVAASAAGLQWSPDLR
jgi:tRNA threonylcarbamoyladenosine biosynthesis protein TsaB